MGTFQGIQFYLDFSWFFIAALVIYSLATFLFPQEIKGLEPAVYIAMATVATLLFFITSSPSSATAS